MKRELFIKFEEAIIESNSKKLKFATGAIHNLFQLNKNLSFQLNFVVDENQNALAKPALEILEQEEINFSIVDKFTQNNNYLIQKNNVGLEILFENRIVFGAKNWNEITHYFKTLLRK